MVFKNKIIETKVADKFGKALACQRFEQVLKEIDHDKIKEFLDYRYSGEDKKNDFIACLTKILHWPKLSALQIFAVAKWHDEAFIKKFNSPEVASMCEKMFIEVGVKDSNGKMVLSKNDEGEFTIGGPLFAVIDILKEADAFSNLFNPSDKVLLDLFNSFLGTNFTEIKRTTNAKNMLHYDNAIKAVRDSFPKFIDYQRFAASFRK